LESQRDHGAFPRAFSHSGIEKAALLKPCEGLDADQGLSRVAERLEHFTARPAPQNRPFCEQRTNPQLSQPVEECGFTAFNMSNINVSKVQPLDPGAMVSAKSHHRRRFMRFLLEEVQKLERTEAKVKDLAHTCYQMMQWIVDSKHHTQLLAQIMASAS
jgi:hypothetical protein